MPTKDQTARLLADAHFRLDEGVDRIIRLVDPNEPEDRGSVKLLEINSTTPEVGISPVGLAADPARDVFYSSVIIEISPSEFDRLRQGELQLPHGWRLGDEIHRRETARRAAS